VRDAEGGGERSEPLALPRLCLNRHCEPFFRKGEAINVIAMGEARSNLLWVVGIPFEIASLTTFARDDGGTSFAMTIRRGLFAIYFLYQGAHECA